MSASSAVAYGQAISDLQQMPEATAPSVADLHRGPTPQVSRARRAVAGAKSFGRRHRTLMTAAISGATAALLLYLLAGRRHEFEAELSEVPVWTVVTAALLQVIGLLGRSEAWHVSIGAAGGRVPRRALYRASSMQVLGSVVNGQLGVAARIGALRRSSPELCPQIPALIAAELPIMAVEATLAALTSFTLIGPLGLPWWLPLILVLVVGGLSGGLRALALNEGRKLWSGLTVMRTRRDASSLIGFVLVAVVAQILRNWLLLNAVGVHASIFDAVAVLIGVVTLSQLPVGPAVGAASAVLILGSQGVAATAAAGILMTATGTLGGLTFAAWAGGDHLWSHLRRRNAPNAKLAPTTSN